MVDQGGAAALPTAAQLAELVVQSIKAVAKSARPLQPSHVAARLTADVLVVMSGARPALLLDYCPGITCAHVMGLAARINTGVPDHMKCGVMSLDGCHLVFNSCATISYLTALMNPSEPRTSPGLLVAVPHLVAFRATGDTCQSRSSYQPLMMTCEAAQVVFNQLASLLTAVMNAANSPGAHMSSSCEAGVQVPHIALDTLPGLPLMPTLFGILLGYPVVYVVEGGQTGAQAASRCLSLTHLLQVKLITTLPSQVLAALPKNESPQVSSRSGKKKGSGFSGLVGNQARDYLSSDDAHVIASFTLPSNLWSHLGTCSDNADHAGAVTATAVPACMSNWARFVQGCLQLVDPTWDTCTVVSTLVEPGLSVTL